MGYFAEPDPSDTLVEDMHTLRTTIQTENPGVPYFMMGHSMGSYMLRKYLCIHPEGVAGAVIMGTGAMPDSTMKFGLFLCRTIALFRGWHYRSRLMQSLSYSKPYKRYDLYGKDYANSWLSKNVENVKTYYADPRCTFLFTVNGYKGLMEAVLFDDQMENIKRFRKICRCFLYPVRTIRSEIWARALRRCTVCTKMRGFRILPTACTRMTVMRF